MATPGDIDRLGMPAARSIQKWMIGRELFRVPDRQFVPQGAFGHLIFR
jgi:hypothetical protein